MTVLDEVAAKVEVRVDARPSLIAGAGGTALFSPCDTYRYALTRTWEPNRPQLLFVMLNPSTADAFAEDPTIRRCLGFARSWGFGGFTVVNAFALRSPHPTALREHPDPVGPHNDTILTAAVAAATTIVVAWGADTFVHKSGRASQVLAVIRAAGGTPLCIGTTDGGAPRHPLFVKKDEVLRAYADPSTVTSTKLVDALRGARFRYRNEVQLHDGIEALLLARGIPEWLIEREVILSAADRVDFLVDGIALEVKVAGGPGDVWRQLHRYATHDRVRELLLVTTRAAHAADAPVELDGKPVTVLVIHGGLA